MPAAAEQLITANLDIWSSAIKAKSAAGRGKSNKLELYGIKKLRELILELAVRGLLVPQDPNDEPASELLEKIGAEKAKLLKDGKIKKPKQLPPIEADDKPFELPMGWSLARLGDLTHMISKGTTPTSVGYTFEEVGVSFIKIENLDRGRIDNGSISQFISEETNNALARSQLQPGDLLFSIAGTIGKTAIVYQEDLPANTNQALAFIRGSGVVFSPSFLRIQLDSLVAEKTRTKARGGAMPNVSLGDLTVLVSPIPPLPEQHRIVAKVDELMALCDQLEQQQETSITAHQTLVQTLLDALTMASEHDGFTTAWARIADHFDTLFTTEWSIDQLKQTILQLAVMGKLAPQDPNDEPASELLKKIAAEKARLMSDGKIRKSKALPSIEEDERPLELPEGWVWCKLGSAGIGATGKTPGTREPRYYGGEIPFIGPGQITPDGRLLGPEKMLTEEGLSGSTEAIPGDILMVCIGGSIGKSVISDKRIAFNQQINSISPVFNSPGYLNIALSAERFYESVLEHATGSATPIINRSKWENLLVPIAPLNEQKRIVEKVDELNEICKSLKLLLQKAEIARRQIADSLASVGETE